MNQCLDAGEIHAIMNTRVLVLSEQIFVAHLQQKGMSSTAGTHSEFVNNSHCPDESSRMCRVVPATERTPLISICLFIY